MDFELYLLMGMVCDDTIKAGKLAEFGVSMDRAILAKSSVGDVVKFNSEQFGNLRAILQSVPMAGERQELRYSLKLWPEYEFHVIGRDGYWHSAGSPSIE